MKHLAAPVPAAAFALALLALVAPTVSYAQIASHPFADRSLGAVSPAVAGTFGARPDAWSLWAPRGITVDPASGKVFVVEFHRVLRFPAAASLANRALAEGVLGQRNFSEVPFATTQQGMDEPTGNYIDRNGRLWVADTANNRVLMFHSAANRGNGDAADLVLGQSLYTSSGADTTANRMNRPRGVFVDDDDHVWVADTGNHRVLRFPPASTLTNGAPASLVLGQSSFTTAISGANSFRFNGPRAVFVDAARRVWVADTVNHRVLRFDDAPVLVNGQPAIRVLGQSAFGFSDAGGGATGMNTPMDLKMDARGTLWVADFDNNRVLGFENAAAKGNGASADRVIGQPDFASTGDGSGPRALNGPLGLAFDPQGCLWVSDFENLRVLRYSPDRAGPRVQLTTRVPRRTSAPRLRLAGTATDPSGVEAVQLRVGRAPFARALGTTSWGAVARLRPGRNPILIFGEDIFGNRSAVLRRQVVRLRNGARSRARPRGR